MAKYELVLVLPGNFEKESLTKLTQKVKKILNGVEGKLDKETEWGLKQLSYPIKHQTSGVYFLWEISIAQKFLPEFRRLLNFETEILRYLLISKN